MLPLQYTPILTLGTAGLEDEVAASGPDAGCLSSKALSRFLSAPMLPPHFHFPVPLAKSSILYEPKPKPQFLCKALLSHPRLRHLYQSFASEPQPACITIKLSCLACLTLLSTLCK